MRTLSRGSYAALVTAFIAFAVGSAAANPTATFLRGLDAYFTNEPYRAIVLVREAMHHPAGRMLREPGLYVLGMSFAQIHLYEKSEDSLNALLNEYADGRFAPVALREMARIFFQLREFGAVVNLGVTHLGRFPKPRIPPEFWYLLGQSHYLLEAYPEASDPLQWVPHWSPFYPFARYTLAQVEFSQGAADNALGILSEVAKLPNAPGLLRHKARRMQGMILYQQGRFADSLEAYREIPPKSPIFGISRVDIALSAEAAGKPEAARDAFQEAIEEAGDDLIRSEAKVAIGRFLSRQRRTAAARTLFEEAVRELKEREQELHRHIHDPTLFVRTFDELVAFGRQGADAARARRLDEDFELLRSSLMGSFGVGYQRPQFSEPKQLTPETYLFPLLQRHFHNPAIIESFIGLTIETLELERQLGKLRKEIEGQAPQWRAETAPTDQSPPQNAEAAIQQGVWLLFAQYDLLSRFYDALAIEEKVDAARSLRAKGNALVTIIDGLRLLLFGSRSLPPREAMFQMMEVARRKIESGEVEGMRAQKVRQAFLAEWRSDRDSLAYVLENLDLKQRQMMSALSGVPLRSRNLNLPILSTMTEWLTALRRLTEKYEHIQLPPGHRPWYLTGRNGELVQLLSTIARDLASLRQQARQVVRDVASELVAKEAVRHSLVTAQAEEGIADALYEERSAR